MSAPAGDSNRPTWNRERTEREALALFQELLRIDTTNPPGNETAAAQLCARALGEEGIDAQLYARTPSRANVIARLKGDGSLPPLLLNAHLDVVPCEPSLWSVPPFAGQIRDGWLYGRGAVDMKNMAALCLAILRELKRSGVKLRRDVIFCGSADEEAGSSDGALWLVEHHPELIRAQYGLGEVGGFSLHLGGRTFYPVMVAQKGVCWFTMRARGVPGHGSIPRRDGAVPRLAQAVAKLGQARLPPHPTAALEAMMRGLSRGAHGAMKAVFPLFATRTVGPRLLELAGDTPHTRTIAALLSNTASPTMLRAGTKTNVHPSMAECVVDGRMLPGQTREEFLREIQAVVGQDIELDVFQEQPAVEMPADTPLFTAIAETIGQIDPDARVVPYMITGFTDAYAFQQLGCTFYGFVPLRLPEDGPAFTELFHGNDERVPVEGFLWGLGVLYELILRICM